MALKNTLLVSVLSGNLLSLAVGMTLSWSSTALIQLVWLDVDSLSWIVSLTSLGAAVGPFLAGYDSIKGGRKRALLGAGVCLVISYIVLAFLEVRELYMTGRFIGGLGVGGMFAVLPQYIAELSEDRNRGALSSSLNVFLCFGLLLSYAIGAYASFMAFNIVVMVISALFFILFAFFATETPHWLIAQKREMEAKEVLIRLRNTPMVDAEFRAIMKSVHDNTGGSIKDLSKASNAKALFVSMGLAFFQQFSGINAVLSFASVIFYVAVQDAIPLQVCQIIVGLVQFTSSFVTPLFVDKMGRKILLTLSGFGMMIGDIILAVYFLLLSDGTVDVEESAAVPVVALIIYLIAYNSGFGPLTWTVMAELFPPNVKNVASAITASFCWLLSFAVTYSFSFIVTDIGTHGIFFMYMGFNVVATIFSMLFVPETKGKSQQEIQMMLER